MKNALEGYLAEILRRDPPLEVDEASPWSITPERYADSVGICLVWSDADRVAPELIQLALEHGLACTDTQNGELYTPDLIRRAPAWMFWRRGWSDFRDRLQTPWSSCNPSGSSAAVVRPGPPAPPYRTTIAPMADLLERITSDPKICGGRPCIRGMRIRVVDVLDLLAADASAEEILEDDPDLEREDLKAAVLYAARSLDRPAGAAS